MNRIEQIGVLEEELTRELQFVLLARQQLLQLAERHGLPSSTLKELLSGLDLKEAEPVFQRIGEAEQRSRKLRHESWV